MTIMQIQYGLGPCLLVFPESITLHWVLHKELLYRFTHHWPVRHPYPRILHLQPLLTLALVKNIGKMVQYLMYAFIAVIP